MSLALNTKHLSSFINEEEYKAIYPQVEAAHKTLEAKNGPGSDFLGWMYLPRDYDKEEFYQQEITIENGITACRKFQSIRKTPDWPQNLLEDFQAVDLSLIEGAIQKIL